MNDLIKYLEEVFCRKGVREIIVPIRFSQLNYFKKLEYNIDTSALHYQNDDIVRPACITKEDAEIHG